MSLVDYNELSKTQTEIENYNILTTFHASTGQKLTIIVIETAIISSCVFFVDLKEFSEIQKDIEHYTNLHNSMHQLDRNCKLL